MHVVNSFRGNYNWASNFYTGAPFEWQGLPMKTSEHFYQFFKAATPEDAANILNAPTPADAKRIAKKVKLHSNWSRSNSVYVMATGLSLKFGSHKDIHQKLLDTKGIYLLEGNLWHDNFWGDCACQNVRGNHPECLNQGLNMLGKLLMLLRDYHGGIEALALPFKGV